MIRVVVQHTPTLFSIGLADAAACTPTFVYDGTTYYRAETHDRYVLYRAALSGGGEAAPLKDPQPVFDPAQQ